MITITGGQMPLSGGTLTGPLAIAVGSAAAPGLAVAGDANTGLWAPAADTLAVSTGGVERLRVSSTGTLQVVVAGQIPCYMDGANSVTTDIRYAVCPIIANINPTTNNWAGVLFSGTSGANAVAGIGAQITDRTNHYGDLVLATKGAGTIAEVVRIKGTGNVGIQITAPTAALHVPASSTARASVRIPPGTAPTIPNAGDIWVDGAVLKFFDGTTTKEIAFV